MFVKLVHRVPGRLRLEINGMQHQPAAAYSFQSFIAGIQGVEAVSCSASTGRALIRVDERVVSVERLLRFIEHRAQSRSENSYSHHEAVAVTKEAPAPDVQMPIFETVPSESSSVKNAANAVSGFKHRMENPYFLPAAASGSLLGVLSLKRLLVGRSLMAAAPVPFYMAAGLSVIAGYPALRRGVNGLIRERRLTSDLWMGIAALSLAALRENLVALSAITLVNIAMYRRHSAISPAEATHLDPAVEHHSKRMSRLSLLLAPATLVVTRSPIKALGVLLAANPRPILQAHKYRWTMAEQMAARNKLALPKKGNLETLAAARTIVIADGSALNQDGNEWQYHIVKEGIDQTKTAVIAASLLQKLEHPWRNALMKAATVGNRTLRSPFELEVAEDGVRGVLNGHSTVFGSKKFVKRNGIDVTAVLFEERRMRREGYKPHLLAQDGELLAIIGRKQETTEHWKNRIRSWQERGYSVRCLRIDERIPCELETITPEQISAQLEQAKPMVIIGKANLPLDSPHLVMMDDHTEIDQLLPFCDEVKSRVHGDLKLAKLWNSIGTSMALFTPITAPLVNLMTDAVGLLLLVKQDWQNRFKNALAPTRKTNKLHASMNGTDKEIFHSMEPEQVLQALGSGRMGLDSHQIALQRKKYGFNTLQPPDPVSPLKVFFAQLKDVSTLVLLGASGLSFVMGEPFNALCMGGILVINALMGTWQEVRSAGVLEALKNQDVSKARVIRQGAEMTVAASELVPGDIVQLEAGDMVPADIRLVDAINLEVNEAMLTGESLPAAKTTKPLPADTGLSDRANMLYMGTILSRGKAAGVVTQTGSRTQIGGLQSLLEQGDTGQTPLQQRISHIGKRFLLGAAIAGGVVAVAGLLRGMPPAQLLISSVTLAASAIPEGLPLTITIALTAGVLRMAKRKTVVRKLASLESLGRVTIICSDKTGTLTKNEMTVKQMVTLNQQIHVTGDGFQPVGQFYSAADQAPIANENIGPDMNRLLTIGMLCNNSSIHKQGDTYNTLGDPTEIALLTVGMKAGLNAGDWTRHKEIPFDSYTKSMSVVCRKGNTSECMILTKGSPEAVLQKSSHYLLNGQTRPITDEIRKQLETENIRMAEKAYRVLGFAFRSMAENESPESAADEGLVFVGLMGMIDPPKDNVAESIKEAKYLGVKTVMITGDHPITARAIASQLGIYHKGDRVITGREMESLSAEQLAELVPAVSVFARVSPEHKLRIVEAYQKNGEVVAMTGDGVNDAPAVNKADVGIAMGAQGTDITKNTAGIILLEDHFQAIVEGIKEGRSIIGNIRKAIGCLLTGNLAEVLVGAAAVVAGLPMPLIPLQILLMNLLTDGLPAMVLATSENRTGADARHNDVVDGSLFRNVVTRGITLGAGSLAVFAGALATGVALPVAQTMAFAALVAGQLIQTVSWRNQESDHPIPVSKDRPLLYAMGVSWAALLAAIYLPGMQTIFLTAPLGLWNWAAVMAVAGSVTTISGVLLKQPRDGSFAQENVPPL